MTVTYSYSEAHASCSSQYPLYSSQAELTFHRPKDSNDVDLVEVYAPVQGPESNEQFPPCSACVFMAITNGGDYTLVCLPYL